jgi:hypothetical protein
MLLKHCIQGGFLQGQLPFLMPDSRVQHGLAMTTDSCGSCQGQPARAFQAECSSGWQIVLGLLMYTSHECCVDVGHGASWSDIMVSRLLTAW